MKKWFKLHENLSPIAEKINYSQKTLKYFSKFNSFFHPLGEVVAKNVEFSVQLSKISITIHLEMQLMFMCLFFSPLQWDEL